jgi:hypothetical protein
MRGTVPKTNPEVSGCPAYREFGGWIDEEGKRRRSEPGCPNALRVLSESPIEKTFFSFNFSFRRPNCVGLYLL